MFLVPESLKLNASIEKDLYQRFHTIRCSLSHITRDISTDYEQLQNLNKHHLIPALDMFEPYTAYVPQPMKNLFNLLLKTIDPWNDLKFISHFISSTDYSMKFNGAIYLRLIDIRRNVWHPKVFKQNGFFAGLLHPTEYYLDPIRSAKYIFVDGSYVRTCGASEFHSANGKFYINPDLLPSIVKRCRNWEPLPVNDYLNQWQRSVIHAKTLNPKIRDHMSLFGRPMDKIVMGTELIATTKIATWDELYATNLERRYI